jgi:DNA-directed RNA polymerase specialized sigma24 family protein
LNDGITQEHFDQLLDWLSPDREKAALQYECIRKRLIKIFLCRGSNTPDQLADATFDRVAKKLREIRPDYVGEPAHYFYGVANYIWQEGLRKNKPPVAVAPPPPAPPTEDDQRDFACLEKCLDELPERERDLVIRYYQQEKHAKIDDHQKMAEELGLSLNALRIRICRIRSILLNCVEIRRSEAAKENMKHNQRPGHTD